MKIPYLRQLTFINAVSKILVGIKVINVLEL